MNDITTLIIDDEENLTKSLAFTLKHADIACLRAHTGGAGLKMAEAERPDIVLLDVRLPDISGLDVLDELRSKLPDTPVIMISAHGDTKDAVRAIKTGAADYLTKPFDVDELIMLIREQLSRKHLESEVRYLREKGAVDRNFIGEGSAIKELRERIGRVAKSTVKTILLHGDTGVGKAVVAREIHNQGGGKDLPFVEINCASLPEQLMEAELFGAEKGAYTGAISKRVGLVEIADTGTLFLDEIGELPLNLQAKLLTFMEARTYRAIGSNREKKADVRVIAATNRDLEKGANEGTFRRDLYFRLNVMPIEIPRLSDRGGDIWLLMKHFAETYSCNEGCSPIIFPGYIREIFECYQWPGNVRELKNLVERLTILHPGQTITENQLPQELRGAVNPSIGTITQDLEAAERELVQKALWECNGKKGIAAEKLGISRHALKRRIQRLGIE